MKQEMIKFTRSLKNVRFTVLSKIILSVYLIAGLTIYLVIMHKREINTVHYKSVRTVVNE